MVQNDERKVLVQVFGMDESGGCGWGTSCGPSCGPEGEGCEEEPATLEEQTSELARYLSSCYGSQVAVEYVDVQSPQVYDHPDAVQILTTRRVPLPLIFVNGQPRFVGGISAEMIGEEVERLGLQPVGPSGS